MPSNFKTIMNISVWILFIKGLLAVLLTMYTVIGALIHGETVPMVAVAGCAVGAFDFILTCIADWIRQKVE